MLRSAARIELRRGILELLLIAAAILALGLHLTGRDDWRVYDGSWDEWGRRNDLPVESANSGDLRQPFPGG